MAHLDTVQKIIDAARILLQDTVAPFRYPEADFIMALNDSMLEARRLRADLFLDNTIPFFANAGDTFSIEAMYRTAFTYYVAGKIQLVDDEVSQDQRATVFLNKFVSQLAISPS